LLLRAQTEGEPCAWVSPRDEASFYPPDFAQAGIDLAALVVVRVPPEAGSHGVVRASELLLRSGAFGLLVVDFSHGVPKGELTWQSRLSGLLRMHDARVVLLTKSEAHEPSLGPMVGLRLEPQVSIAQLGSRDAPASTSTRVSLGQRVLKCKLGGALSISPDIREPPLGAVRHA
jgi:recombination protein RecA